MPNDQSYIDVLRHGITERGNTALINYETGASLFYTEVEDNQWLEISLCPENYPAWQVSIVDKSKSEIRKHIEERLSDPWQFQKNNIGANEDGKSPACLEYVMECVRDELYIYRDNKDVDTVATIHTFLKQNEWTLDIADSETLRQEFDE